MNNQNTPLNSSDPFNIRNVNPFMMPLYPPIQPINYITNYNFNFNGNRVDEKDISIKVENGEHKFNVRDSNSHNKYNRFNKYNKYNKFNKNNGLQLVA